MRRFRTIFYKLLPWWATTGEYEKVIYSLHTLIDINTQRLQDGIRSRFPSYAGKSALKLIGDSRAITRGRDESDASYARRLKAWRYPRGHRVRGNTFALLEQIAAYFGGADGGIYCWAIDRKGNKRVRSAEGAISYSYGNAWDWDGAPMYPRWARFWLVLEPNPELDVQPWPTFAEGTWGGGTLGEAAAAGYCIGHSGISHQDAKAVKDLLRAGPGRRPWKAAGTKAEFAIISFENHPGTAPEPDGLWGSYQGRDPSYRYWNLHQ